MLPIQLNSKFQPASRSNVKFRFIGATFALLVLVSVLNTEANAQFFRRGFSFRSSVPQHSFEQIPEMVQPTVKNDSSQSGKPKEYRPKSYNGQKIEKGKIYQTKFRHVYRPIKNGLTKKGSNGQMVILAQYVGTHEKVENEEKLDDYQDLQHGSMSQNLIKTSKNVKMWKEPFLDGTLRWVPLIKKNTSGKTAVELLQKELTNQQ